MRHKKNLEARWERVRAWQVASPEALRGRWCSALMPRAEGLWLELGCGRGAFACALARREQGRLVVAAERVRDAMITGMERAGAEALENLRFIAGDAGRLGEWFAEGELGGLFVHFCDPWPNRRHAKRRLVAGPFLDIYRPLLAEGAVLRFKTDNAPLFDFAMDELQKGAWTVLEACRDLPRGGDNIETEYERRFREEGVPIHALTACPAKR